MPRDLSDLANVERPSRLPLYLGILLLVAGWVVLILGWYQAGQQDLETGQIPYLISGGFGGFGLILMGIISILADVVRQAETKLRRSAEDLHRRMEDLAEVFVAQQAEREAPKRAAASPVQRRTQRRRAAAD